MNPSDQRVAAIGRAAMFRDGVRTIDSEGREVSHTSISAAKRHSRMHAGVGRCVAQQRGEDLFTVMRERIAAAERAKAEAEAA